MGNRSLLSRPGTYAIYISHFAEKIIIGGGVMKQSQLFPLIHAQVKILLNGYASLSEITERIDEYIVPPKLGDDAGTIGALMLAKQMAVKNLSK
ncbi:ROK family protein [Bacillus sp. N9]